MKTIEQLLPDHPFFAGLAPETIELIAGCAGNIHVGPGQYLFHEDDPADAFYLVRSGRVALQVRTPTADAVLDAIHEGDVIGWSWLVPPYRWTFDARATEETSLVAFEATCLREKCQRDATVGYELLTHVVQVIATRLHSARVRLLDMYGNPT